MKRTFVAYLLTLMCAVVTAQTTPLTVQLDSKNQPYLVHTLAPKENFYSVGRIYNISPRVFAPYNGLELTSPLSIGQAIRIPLNEQNFWQAGGRKENEVVLPLYYTVGTGENLAAISRTFKTDNASLKSWNNLSSDAVATGKKIIIGFLKVDKTLSPLAAQGMSRQEPPMVKQEPKKEQPKPVVKEEPKKEEPKVEPKVEPKPEPKKEEPKPVVKEEPKTQPAPASYEGNGFFKDEYNKQSNNGRNTSSANGNGATFKSTSGWSDGKYYVLMDNLEKGTIVMVRNPSNGKAIYAKVLAGVKETTPNSSALFLLSNAAASQLGISAEKFNAELVWGK
ncbi:LysM peptidoglycan-binding domain-containing protein [Lacibacter sp. MH-610]|uniref:LysM peptidoglycan-binding domain-containing protein n=1 Tax=Lacibacter sp. MH-610 TaxID=3020883 RepID=UPI00389272A6